MRNKNPWIGIIALVGIIAPFSNAANAVSRTNSLSSETSVTRTAANKAAFLVSREQTISKYENAATLTDSQLVELLKAVGFKGKGLKTAWAVAKAESNGQPIRFNGNIKTGDHSFGLFQINMIGDLGPDRRDRFNIDYDAQLLNPVVNAEIVYKMTDGGTNWKAWKYARTPAVQKWLKQFPAYVKA